MGGIAYPFLSGLFSPPLDVSPCLISVHEWEGLLQNPSRGFRAVGGISVAKDDEVDYTATACSMSSLLPLTDATTNSTFEPHSQPIRSSNEVLNGLV